MSSFWYWKEHLAHARNGYDRPVGSNTRVHWSGEDAIAIRYHYTDVVTFHRDGRIQLAAHGWHTITTAQRLHSYSPARLSSWKIPFEHDPEDPEPLGKTHRQIMRPFFADDPGPEPVDDGVGCRVGEVEEYELQGDKTIYDWRAGENPLDVGRGFPLPPSEWNREQGHVEVRLTRMHRVEYVGAGEGGYYGNWQAEEEARKRGHEPKRCAHCRAFSERHEEWWVKMNGHRWRRRESQERGFRQMNEHLEQFGTREDWQDAYITEFREVRANKAEHRAWRERNVCPFYDGIEVLPSGYVPLRLKRQHLKNLRAKERAQRKHDRMVREHEALVRKRMAREKEERRVKQQIVLALAGNVNVELDALRPRWQEIKEKHHGAERGQRPTRTRAGTRGCIPTEADRLRARA